MSGDSSIYLDDDLKRELEIVKLKTKDRTVGQVARRMIRLGLESQGLTERVG